MTADLPLKTEQLDPAIAALLSQLWRAESARDAPWSLPRLCKQAGLRMSTLRRSLSLLDELGLTTMRLDETGQGDARLTEQGKALCRQLFSPAG
ncbi:ArsR family transcriptional regulator [Chromobacterium paludis]|uniref:ArsR family transcriptional regulator n=1 Tax=Chromobacterium paludis TaxID=2605945 RepID=A0A5C1DDB2_9NEIS|nr:ArsR family transcriptional regulator [Chromobacterium paludis]QEL54650.1 ArsR family transcriptional regulator [Chromobacterium paludis]